MWSIWKEEEEVVRLVSQLSQSLKFAYYFPGSKIPFTVFDDLVTFTQQAWYHSLCLMTCLLLLSKQNIIHSVWLLANFYPASIIPFIVFDYLVNFYPASKIPFTVFEYLQTFTQQAKYHLVFDHSLTFTQQA